MSHALSRGFMTASVSSTPDEARSARMIVKDLVNAKLLYCTPPPGLGAEDYAGRTERITDRKPLRNPTSQRYIAGVQAIFDAQKEVRPNPNPDPNPHPDLSSTLTLTLTLTLTRWAATSTAARRDTRRSGPAIMSHGGPGGSAWGARRCRTAWWRGGRGYYERTRMPAWGGAGRDVTATRDETVRKRWRNLDISWSGASC